MIVTLLLILLFQDGPIRTAPPLEPAQAGAPTSGDPGPACTFGGRPVRAAGCPVPEGRIVMEVPAPEPSATAPTQTPGTVCRESANRLASESQLACIARLGREAQARRAAAEEDTSPWTQIGRPTAGEGGYHRNAGAAAESDLPAWALSDPARWETSQCGTSGDDACRRQARNRLAMARAGLATDTPAEGGSPASAQNCRMVMQRSETGFGGSLSRVCGDGAAAEAALNRLNSNLRPTVEPCDRPATLETQEAWIARCRALPPR